MATERLKAVVTNTNFITGSGGILLGIFMYVASYDIQEFVTTRVGAAFLPRIAAVLFMLLGGLLFFNSLRCAPPVVTKKAREEASEQDFGGLPAVFLSLLLMVAYVGLLESVGFVITSVVYIFLQILVLAKQGQRHYLMFALVAVIVPIIVFYLFVHVFKVLIPAGILG